jgi:hypothetical protein
MVPGIREWTTIDVIRRGGLLLAVMGLVASGCAAHELSPVYQRLGAEPSGTSLRVWYLPCPGERVDELDLWDLDSDNTAGNNGDVILWTASEGELSALATPPIVPRRGSELLNIDDDVRYYLEVYTTQGAGDTGSFFVSDLEEGRIRVDLQTLSMEEFRTNAANSCK